MTIFKKLFVPLMLVFLASPIMGFALEEGQPQSLMTSPLVVDSDGGSFAFEVELAVTLDQQHRGLMFRSEMAEDHGMLFYYSFPQRVSFWMRNTYIPLDLIFIKEDGTIANIVHNAEPLILDSLKSKGIVMGVLELNGGMAEKLGLEKGDQVHHMIFGNAPEAATGEGDD